MRLWLTKVGMRGGMVAALAAAVVLLGAMGWLGMAGIAHVRSDHASLHALVNLVVQAQQQQGQQQGQRPPMAAQPQGDVTPAPPSK